MTERRSIWGQNNDLYVYLNQEKINDLLGRIWGELITSFNKSEKKGNKKGGDITAKLGGLVSLLGLGEIGGDVGFEVNIEKGTERISTLTFDNKISILNQYLNKHEKRPYINIYDGTELIDPKVGGILVPEWETKPIEHKEECIGIMLGLFLPYRISPPPVENTSPCSDLMSKVNSLWEFRSIEESKFKALIPWVTSNFRFISQHALITLAKYSKTGLKVEAFGLICFDGNTYTCDPISFRIFY